MLLKDFFKENPRVALAFSGGTDSAYLLHMALKHCKKVIAYYVKSEFQPQFEYEDALNFAKEKGIDLKIIDLDILAFDKIKENPENRCYYCKKAMFEAIKKAALEDGIFTVIEGTNASDNINDRPGFIALQELGVKSPLRECNLTKQQIRSLSAEAGLKTFNKPAYACLATRIKAGEEITSEKLIKTEKSENFLFSLGYSDFRVRTSDNNAKIQVNRNEYQKILYEFENIEKELLKYYDTVQIDREVIR